jgi:hypothetical protein
VQGAWKVKSGTSFTKAIDALLGQRSIAKANPFWPKFPNFLQANEGVTWLAFFRIAPSGWAA